MRSLRALVAALAVTAITALAPAGAAIAQPTGSQTADTQTAGTQTANAQATASAATDGKLATLSVERLTPWLDATGTLRVTGSVTAKTKISAPHLRLRMSSRTFDSRDGMTTWSKGGGTTTALAAAAATPQVPSSAKVKTGSGKKAKTKTYKATVSKLPTTLAKGQTARFDFQLPAATLPLDTADALNSWGARGLSLDLAGNGTDEQSVRSFTTWYPDPKIQPTKLGVLIPVTAAQYAPSGTVTPAWLESQAADGGNLDSLLNSVTANPQAVLAVDPQLLMSVMAALRTDAGSAATAGPKSPAKATASATSTATSTDAWSGGTTLNSAAISALTTSPANDRYPRLRAWWRQLARAADGKRVLALPWADSDLGALRKAKLSEQATQARKARTIVAQFFPGARTDTDWPRAGALSNGNLASALSGKGTLLLSDAQAVTSETYTGNARSTVTGTDSDGEAVAKKDVLVTDSGLERLAAARAGAGKNSALATADLAAASAAITAERPFAHRTMLMTLPRTAASTGWAGVSALPTQLPWLETADLSTLTKAESTTRTAQSAKQTDTGQAAASAQHATGKALAPLRKPVSAAQSFSAIFTDAERARARNDRSVLSCASVGWDDPAAGTATSQAKTVWDSTSHPKPTADANGQTQAPSAQDQPITSGKRSACIGRLSAGLSELQKGITVERSSSVLLVTGEKTTIPVHVENTTDLPASFKATLVSRAPGLKTAASDTVTVEPGETARVEVPVEGIANSDVTAAIRLLTVDGTVVVDRSSMAIRVRADWENIGTAVIGAGLLFVFLFGLVKAVRKGKRKIPEDQLDAALAREQERDSQ